jgi:putative two-component system response regulator
MDGIEVLKQIRNNNFFKNLPILMVTANPEKEIESFEYGANDFIAKPYDIGVLVKRTINYAKLHCYTKQVVNQKDILEEKVKERTKELRQTLKLAKEAEYEISVRLGKASEYRDLETGGHIKRISLYSQTLASLYGLKEKECELILYAAPLHDIGKVGISDKILLKPARFNQMSLKS